MIDRLRNTRKNEETTPAIERTSLRNPPALWRRLIVGAVYAGPGCLAGLMIDLAPQPVLKIAMILCGATIGFLIGALLERK